MPWCILYRREKTHHKQRTRRELQRVGLSVCAVCTLLLLLWFLNLCYYSTDFFLYFDPPFFEIPVKKNNNKVLEIKLFKKPFSWCTYVYSLPFLVTLSWILTFSEDVCSYTFHIREMVYVLVCLSCHNNTIQPGRLNQQTSIFWTFWRLEVQDHIDSWFPVRPLFRACK